MTCPKGIAGGRLPQLFQRCLICGLTKNETASQFRWIGLNMLTNWKRRRQAAVWIKDYIGLEVNQACLCHQCFVHIETLHERVQTLKEKCMKNIRSLAVSIGSAVSDHTYSVGEDGKNLDVVIPEKFAKSMMSGLSDGEGDQGENDQSASTDAKESEESFLCLVCDMRFNSQRLLKNHAETHGKTAPPSRKRRSKEQVSVKEKEIISDLKALSGPVTRGRSARAAKCKPLLPKKTGRTASRQKPLGASDPSASSVPTSDKQSLETDQEDAHGESEKTTKRKLNKGNEPKQLTVKRKMTYKCKICPAEFTSTLYYSRHMESHDKYYSDISLDNVTWVDQDGKPYQCKICGEEFESDDKAFSHMKDVHSQSVPYQCKICDRKLSSRSSMRVHLLNHSGNKAFQCSICSRKYGHRGALNRHLKTHKTKDHLCQLCGKLFSTKNTLEQHHVRIHTKTLVFSHACEVCGKRFDRLSKLSLHRTIHSKDKNHLCDICGKTFKHEWVLKNHTKLNCGSKVKSELERRSKPPTQARAVKCPRPHKCTACNRRYTTIEQLADHVTLSHEKECILCGVAIYSSAALRAHKSVCKLGQRQTESQNDPKRDVAKLSPKETVDGEASEAPIIVKPEVVVSNQSEGQSNPTQENQRSDSTQDINLRDTELSYTQEIKSGISQHAESVPSEPVIQTGGVMDASVETILFTLSEGAKPSPAEGHILQSTVTAVQEDPTTSSEGQLYNQSQGDVVGNSVSTPLTIDPAMVETLTAAGVTGSQIRMEDGTIVLLLDEHSVTGPSHAGESYTIM